MKDTNRIGEPKRTFEELILTLVSSKGDELARSVPYDDVQKTIFEVKSGKYVSRMKLIDDNVDDWEWKMFAEGLFVHSSVVYAKMM